MLKGQLTTKVTGSAKQTPTTPTRDLSVLLPGIYLAVALLVLAGVIALLKRWRRGPDRNSLGASEQLAQFRSLYERGDLSEEEFNRLRNLLGGQLRQALDVPPRPAPPAGKPPGPDAVRQPPKEAGPPDTGIRPG